MTPAQRTALEESLKSFEPELTEKQRAEMLLILDVSLVGVIEQLRSVSVFCIECGDPGTRHFDTEGDGSYWLCDSVDYDHGTTYYGGEPARWHTDHLRAYLGTPEPQLCEACLRDDDTECEVCKGTGWVQPKETEDGQA